MAKRGSSKERLAQIGKATQITSGEQAAKMGRKGGIESQRVQHERKSMRQRLVMLMNAPVSPDVEQKMRDKYGIEDVTQKDLASVGLLQKAQKGDVLAYEKLVGYEQTQLENDAREYELPARVLGKAFVDINRRIVPNKTYVFKGGRGGLKSSYVSLKIIELLKNNPNMHACVVRKVAGTLKDSVYAQLKWAIHELGLDDEFTPKSNPLEIVYKKTGQTIYFRGVDKPEKLKSIKPPFGYIGILWKEEKDQLTGAAEERSINQSVLRGEGSEFYDLSSFNPPKSKDNWVNKELLQPDPNRVVHHSTYKDAPPEWLGQKFLDDAEHLRKVNPDAYDHEYEGEANGEGGLIFNNIEAVELTDEAIAEMDWIYQGVDWGDAPDPSVFVRLYYDTDSDSIFFIDEMYGNHMGNTQIADWIKEHKYDDYDVICDSAEKRSTRDLIDLGIRARNAKKGAGSVAYGMKWLENRKIFIDPQRTPNVWREFSKYEFERDKEGNIISGYPDKNNHTIDATRYALERFYNKRYTQA